MSLSPEDKARLDERCDLLQAITDAHPESADLVRRFDDVCCDSEAATEARVLRIAGGLLLEHGLGDLFEEIYRFTHAGSDVQPGDGRRFLFRGT